MNRLKGEAPLKLSDGREFVFHLDFDALVEAEQAYGKPLPRLMADASQGYVGAEVAVSVVSLAERLFELNIGNSLNSAWHKSVWPGELGHDNATGLSIPVAWGVESPRSSGGGTTSPYYSPPDWRERGI